MINWQDEDKRIENVGTVFRAAVVAIPGLLALFFGLLGDAFPSHVWLRVVWAAYPVVMVSWLIFEAVRHKRLRDVGFGVLYGLLGMPVVIALGSIIVT